MDLFLIDGIGPFFHGVKKRQLNWSKIPFYHLPTDPADCRERFERIAQDLQVFAAKAAQLGFNGITLDDVAHLSQDPWLEQHVNERIAIYQQEYQKLFEICNRAGLQVFLTMDVVSLTPGLKEKIDGRVARAILFLGRQVENVLSLFPEIGGLILRIGECDGKDVRGTFKSELLLQTPGQVNRLVHELLPIFEKHQKTMVLRNWTVGAYQVGDLIWHRRTMAKVLGGVESENFVLSLKYGESDFFRYLPLNRQFFRHGVKKIIELQARREYEGCGEYPSFIGWDYEKYARELEGATNIVGVSVWCQTGGWVPFRRRAFLEESAIWNELNTHVSIKIFKEKFSVEEAVSDFAGSRGIEDHSSFLQFLRLNDEVIKDLLYIREVADQKLFFRRVRIPPLLAVFWNNIFINHSVRKVLLTLVDSCEDCVRQGYDALEKIKQMEELAIQLRLPSEDIRYMYDTFYILVLAREYYFMPYNETLRKRIRKAKRKYKKKYPKESRPRYRIKTNFAPFSVSRRHLSWLLSLALRKKRGYRVIDYLLTLHLLGLIFRVVILVRPSLVPKFARDHAMGIDAVFK